MNPKKVLKHTNKGDQQTKKSLFWKFTRQFWFKILCWEDLYSTIAAKTQKKNKNEPEQYWTGEIGEEGGVKE